MGFRGRTFPSRVLGQGPGGGSETGLSRGGRGEVLPGPAEFGGAPPSLKNTEKGVPGGFFLTSNVHNIHFRPSSAPEPPRKLTTLPTIDP